MRLNALIHSTSLRTFSAIVVVAALVIAARPGAGRTVPLQGGQVVQVRDFPQAPIVEIVAWSATSPAFGLRTSVRKSGGVAERYHRLWVATDFNPAGRDVTRAQGLNRPLPVTNASDTQNCMSGQCSPGSTFGARFQDSALRESKGDVEVRFVREAGGDFSVTVRRALIDAYFVKVDSVIAALKK